MAELRNNYQTQTGVHVHGAHQARSDKYRGFADIPDNLRFRQDRGKHRSHSELKFRFPFEHEDSRSTDVPRVLRLLCAYLVGLQIVQKRLQDASHVSMETDAPEAEPPEPLFDDDASDADFIWCGMTSREFHEKLELAKKNAMTYSFNEIYLTFIYECCTEEESFVKKVQQLRNDPSVDVGYFCRNNLIAHTNSMIEKWKRLNAVATEVHRDMETLKKTSFPCMKEYSDTELHFGPDEYLRGWENTSHITLPEKWELIDVNASNNIRQIKTEVIMQCKTLQDEIMMDLTEMENARKENYIKLLRRYTGLTKVVSALSNILSNITSDAHFFDARFTEEEIWYNESDFSYVETYNTHDDARTTSDLAWNRTAKQERHSLATKVVHCCGTIHQQYGELVRELRTRRESLRPGIKTHVTELETRVVQQESGADKYVSELEGKIFQLQSGTNEQVVELHTRIEQLQNQMTKNESDFTAKEKLWFEKDLRTQQTNARLTSELDDVKNNADYLKQQLTSQWRQYCLTMKEDYNRQIKTQQAKQDEMMNRIADLKREKENLLTRLSKIAGSKLVQGNPAITDLSDTNRPTKLSERYSELYDNEWTDALEELIDRHVIVQGGDVVCTQILLAILTESFKFCCETEAAYVKTIKQSVTSLPGSDPDGADQDKKKTSNETSLSQELNQQLIDVIKAGVLMMTPAVESKFLALMEKQFEHMIKQPGGSIKSTGIHEPGKSEDTDGQATKLDTAELDESKQPKSEESDSTQNSTPTSDKDPTSLTNSSPSEQGPNDVKRHRQFNQGPSNVVLDQGNNDTEDTCHGSAITNTTCLVRFSSLEKTNNFAKCCVNLCWLMRSQNPPLHMDTELAKDSDISLDFYKNYTQKGKKVDFLVWPALFLHKDGPLLCKGIVQPLSIRKG